MQLINILIKKFNSVKKMKTTIDHKFNVGDKVFIADGSKVRQGKIIEVQFFLKENDKMSGKYRVEYDINCMTTHQYGDFPEREVFTSPTETMDFIFKKLKEEIYNINKDYLQ